MIDTHTHVVSPDKEAYPLNPRSLSGQWYLDGPASAEELALAMGKCGVQGAVLVQGVGAYTYDNRYAADAAEANRSLFASACCLDVEAEDAIKKLDHWVLEKGMQGIRLFAICREGPSWLIAEETFPIWKRAMETRAHIIVTILPHQLDELEFVLKRFPATPISLDHCAFATAEAPALERLLSLARYPHLNLKISTHNLDDATRREGSARPLIETLVQQFGAHRLMWGSDFCQTHDRPYAELVDLARDAFSDLSQEDRSACLAGTARTLWPSLDGTE